MKIVIIEDEQFTAEDLASTIRSLRKDYSILKILPSVKEANDFFSGRPQVDLVFSDIHLGDGLSFEIFRSGNCTCPVIFCTAYDNYAMQGFKANGIDYILKPVDKTNILEAIEKFERITGPAPNVNNMMVDLMELFKQPKDETKHRSILVHHKDKIIPVKVEDIAVFYIRNECTWILDEHGKSYPISESLEDIEHMNASFLFRANRQFIVNRKAVRDASQHFARKLIINLSIPFQEQISVSKEKSPAFLKWLENS
jgi:two-component system, LytTR family, response regulator LytT